MDIGHRPSAAQQKLQTPYPKNHAHDTLGYTCQEMTPRAHRNKARWYRPLSPGSTIGPSQAS